MFDIVIDDATDRHLLVHILKTQEKAMTDFSKLTADIAALAAKVDAHVAADTAKDARIADLEAQLAAVANEQPAVDAADGAVQEISAKIS